MVGYIPCFNHTIYKEETDYVASFLGLVLNRIYLTYFILAIVI